LAGLVVFTGGTFRSFALMCLFAGFLPESVVSRSVLGTLLIVVASVRCACPDRDGSQCDGCDGQRDSTDCGPAGGVKHDPILGRAACVTRHRSQ
jgi:hypothetical protein